ncbi:MAG: hypothetical protein C6I01_04545 [Epsilonproteobacteria bacterium]|nr:hypothetical protein [Campylobacterota bacterium]
MEKFLIFFCIFFGSFYKKVENFLPVRKDQKYRKFTTFRCFLKPSIVEILSKNPCNGLVNLL